MPNKLHEDLRDYYTSTKWTVITEAKDDPVVDGKRVLAKVSGAMSVIDGESLNGRHYSKKLWENCIKNVLPKLNEGGMFGTCGHKVALDENSIASGALSHKVTKLWIDESEKAVMGEILILNTDSGRNVDLYMREGYNLSVSTRAYGDIEPGKGPNGSDLVLEDSFVLESIDFVVNPGVAFAKPKIVESNITEEESTYMSEKLMEALQTEKSQLTVQLHEALKDNKQLTDESNQLKATVKQLQESLGDNPVKSLQLIEEGLRKWLELEPFKSLAIKTNRWRKGERPGIQSIQESLVDILEMYSELGSPEQIQNIINENKAIAEFGQLKDIERVVNDVKAYRALGKTPKEIEAKLNESKVIVSKYKQARRDVEAKRIVKTSCPNLSEALFKKRVSTVSEMLKKNKVSVVEKQVKELYESSVTDEKYRADNPNKTGKVIPSTPKVEAKGGQSGAARLFESIKPATKNSDSNKSFFEKLRSQEKK